MVRARQQKWATRRVRQGSDAPPAAGLAEELRSPVGVHPVARDPVPARVRATVHTAGDRILSGDWPLLGVVRTDLAEPDWFLDPVTGRRAPSDVLAFSINQRDESATGNVKQVWELSRHHHLTQLAAAYWITGDEQYAEAVDRQLRSWWDENPLLSGIHWTSGIELGVRLVSWVWIRRLLDEWPKVQDLFEHHEACRRQVRWHQEYLAAFHSEGSSGNNHAVAEDVGLLVAACGMPWFEESDSWRELAAERFRRHFRANTGADGLNREQATDYHRFVTELALVALTEARASGHDLGGDLWALVTSSLDAAAAVLDVRGRAPRQGDGDEGRALVLDGDDDPWTLLLSAGAATVGRLNWWPETSPSLVGSLLGWLADRSPEPRGGRNSDRVPSPPPGWCCSGRRRSAGTRSGAVATAGHTGSCRSRHTRTRMHCRSRSATTGSTSSPTPAPTATTASESGGGTSAPLGPTTRSASTAATSRSPEGRSCGPSTHIPSRCATRPSGGVTRPGRPPRTATRPCPAAGCDISASYG